MNNIIKLQNQSVRQNLLQAKLQTYEVKQLADMEAKFCDECKKSIQAYKGWKRCYSQETDVVELIYRQLTGIILRRHAENSIQAYWVMRSDFRKIFHRYIAQIPSYDSKFGGNKHA